ncbi:hypothetical protein AHAS_Ahas19G0164500 [Arachis hypogaea]
MIELEAYEGMNNDNEENFEANYDTGDKNEDGDEAGQAVVQNVVVLSIDSQPFNVLPCIAVLQAHVVSCMQARPTRSLQTDNTRLAC